MTFTFGVIKRSNKVSISSNRHLQSSIGSGGTCFPLRCRGAGGRGEQHQECEGQAGQGRGAGPGHGADGQSNDGHLEAQPCCGGRLRTKSMKLYSELTLLSGKALKAAADLLKTCNCDTPTQKVQQIMDRNDLLTYLSSDKDMPFNAKDAASIRERLG